MRYRLHKGRLSQGNNGPLVFLHLFVSHFLIQPQTMTYFIVSIAKFSHSIEKVRFTGHNLFSTTCSHLGEKRRTIGIVCLLSRQQSNFKPFVSFCFCIFGGASTLVRAAMNSDNEIFLTQNTFSQEPFSPELNLEEFT